MNVFLKVNALVDPLNGKDCHHLKSTNNALEKIKTESC